MEFYEHRYRWADDLCNVGRSKGRSSRMDGGKKSKSREEAAEEMGRVVEACKLMTMETPIDATIEAHEIMLAICSEAEKELVEGLKTVDELGWLVERRSKGKELASNQVGSEKRNRSDAGTSNPPSTNVSCSVETRDIDNSPHGGWCSQGDRRDSNASSCGCALHRAQEASED
ncbi:hypothetical protein R1sor_000793 [Riccia sorocarpa]|uniref:Uncharacterized protein n=1 Tax=Riccia sorocarpa TaxID=122646 RepID=A0ABD3GW32_9MARC